MGSWSWDVASNRVTWSPEMEAALRRRAGHLRGHVRRVPRARPPRRPRHGDPRAARERRPRAGVDFSMEHRVVLPDGSVLWFQGRGSPVRGSRRHGHELDRCRDRHHRDASRSSRSCATTSYEMRLAFSAGHMGFWRWNARTGTGHWSPELEDLVGVERGSYDGTWDVVHPADPRRGRPAAPRRDHRGVRDAATSSPSATASAAATASIRWIETRGRELDDGDWIGVSIDVTDQRRAEEALRESNDAARGDRRPARHAARQRAARLRVLRPGPPLRPREPAAGGQQRSCRSRSTSGGASSEVLPDVGPKIEHMLATRARDGCADLRRRDHRSDPGPTGRRAALARELLPGGRARTRVRPSSARSSWRSPSASARSVRRGSTAAVSELLAASPDLERAARPGRVDHGPRARRLVRHLPASPHRRRAAVRDRARRIRRWPTALVDADVRWPLDIPRMLDANPNLRDGHDR